jgi:hypothetical protein
MTINIKWCNQIIAVHALEEQNRQGTRNMNYDHRMVNLQNSSVSRIVVH